MFEWHGWASIRGSYTVADDEKADYDGRVRRSMVDRLLAVYAHDSNEVVGFRFVSGGCHVWLAGSHNHRSEEPIDLVRAISAAAPGRYGIMHGFDHNHFEEPWQHWVMCRGHIHLQQVESLSPHIGLVEGPDDSGRGYSTHGRRSRSGRRRCQT